MAQLGITSGSHRRCRLLREYQRLLEATGGAATPEALQIQAQLEETLCGQASALERAEASLVQSEAQLRHAQKMEAVGCMAGGVAHDFNNILSVILGATDLLLADLKAGDPAREDVEMIREAGARGAALTHQLLMFSRRQMAQPTVVDTEALLSDIERMLRRVLGEDIILVCQVENPAPHVKADPGLLEQVLMNLAVNARDAMPHGGQLEIDISSVELAAAIRPDIPAGAYAVFTITDTGTGMDAATQARVFEPFFTTKEPGRGTGLGLSTVFGIVKQSGGSISLLSELDKGTRFVIYLPRVKAEVDAKPRGLTRPLPRGTETILVVEDEDAVRRIASSLLRRFGYKVLEARNAGEALLVCEKHLSKIDLLLVDIVMPQMSGPELVARLADVRADMKVLFMSGYTGDAIGGTAHADGHHYLQKPLTVDALTKKVREVLDARPEPSPLGASSAA